MMISMIAFAIDGVPLQSWEAFAAVPTLTSLSAPQGDSHYRVARPCRLGKIPSFTMKKAYTANVLGRRGNVWDLFIVRHKSAIIHITKEVYPHRSRMSLLARYYVGNGNEIVDSTAGSNSVTALLNRKLRLKVNFKSLADSNRRFSAVTP